VPQWNTSRDVWHCNNYMWSVGSAANKLILPNARNACYNKNYTWRAASTTAKYKETWCCNKYNYVWHAASKGKAIPLQAWTGPDGSRSLRLPYFKTVGTWKWQGCQPYEPSDFTPHEILLVLIFVGARGGMVVEALSYKPKGCRIDFRWCHWYFSLT
jgi:hypothetical protein